MSYLKMNELKHGYLYKIKARNAEYGIWDKNEFGFVISRFKFDLNYVFEEYHWDASEDFGTAKPLEEIEKSPFTKFDEHDSILVYLNEFGSVNR
jgi:hypothetical protein